MDYRFSRLGTYESTQFLVPNPACRSQGTVRELFCQGAEFGGFRQDLGMNIQKPQHFLLNPWKDRFTCTNQKAPERSERYMSVR